MGYCGSGRTLACTSTRGTVHLGSPAGPANDAPESQGSLEGARTPPSRRLTIVVRLRRVSSPSVAAGQPLPPEVPGERTHEDRLDSRLRLTWLAAIRDGEVWRGRPAPQACVNGTRILVLAQIS